MRRTACAGSRLLRWLSIQESRCWNSVLPANTAVSRCHRTRPRRASARMNVPIVRIASTRYWTTSVRIAAAVLCPGQSGRRGTGKTGIISAKIRQAPVSGIGRSILKRMRALRPKSGRYPRRTAESGSRKLPGWSSCRPVLCLPLCSTEGQGNCCLSGALATGLAVSLRSVYVFGVSGRTAARWREWLQAVPPAPDRGACELKNTENADHVDGRPGAGRGRG